METVDRNGIQRRCGYCEHFNENHSNAQDPDVQGVCFKGGFTEISHPDKPLTREDCNAFELAKLLKEAENLWLNEDGEIVESSQ